jgi:thymidylate synthase (FAD)
MQVSYIQHCGTDLSVVNAARVSFKKTSDYEYDTKEVKVWDNWLTYTDPKTRRLSEQDTKLINYLAKHQHYSPFNHTFVTLHVEAPMFVARQLQKHEYMPWNEVSRRYVDDPPTVFDIEFRERPDKSIKQGSGDVFQLDTTTELMYYKSIQQSLDTYDRLIEQNVAPEVARAVLPMTTNTEWYWSGTLKAWAKMYNLRIDSHAQKETQTIARLVGEIIQPLFPVSWKALTNGEV